MVLPGPTWTTNARRACLPLDVLQMCGPDGPLNVADAAVLLWLSDLAWRQAPYPGHATLARLTGLSSSTIRRAIERAQAAGVLTASDRGDGRVRRYVLHNPALSEQGAPTHPALSGQGPHTDPALREQATLPPEGRYPALSEQVLLTTESSSKGRAVNGATKAPPRTATDAIVDLVYTASMLDPTLNTSRLRGQLAAAHYDLQVYDQTRQALLKQRDHINNVGAWTYSVATKLQAERRQEAS